MQQGRRKLLDIYHLLLGHYGPQGWWPVTPPGGSSPVYGAGAVDSRGRLEVTVGAVLAQNTSWSGARKALENLIAVDCLDFRALSDVPEHELAALIRPSGYFNQKARRIKNLVSFLGRSYDGAWEKFYGEPVAAMRQMLLELHGIGPETADSIILYAAGGAKFVIDNYTRRLCYRLGLADKNISYGELQEMFEEALPRDSCLYGEYHALIVVHGKERCMARRQLCGDCPLASLCRRRGLE